MRQQMTELEEADKALGRSGIQSFVLEGVLGELQARWGCRQREGSPGQSPGRRAETFQIRQEIWGGFGAELIVGAERFLAVLPPLAPGPSCTSGSWPRP